ncbi:hypothetical protein EW093_13055 [Thiospirochaeta perfilievii]|uniref:AAA-ATPase-like domain-containing protein n=1 Tax=Thiospirochaeta perfilievii TaxID=252967 RepID=A0A5C1QH77_9SPIO|nr:ATP-binding protein [Thiospirochaeta perfilievii]QEN05602.1 hypothetical protein EW093_13055 [Thiospirochaeta perfilievii]
MTKLPTGIQTFSKIREDNYAYVDKTRDIYNLINNGTYYFLSRPRRFGKSLLIDTISELFKGSKEYFKGLFIYDKWDWSIKYPVIKINFAAGTVRTPETLNSKINFILEDNCKRLGINYNKNIDLYHLIQSAHEKYGQKVVVLVDEYDKPIIDAIKNKVVAAENREILGDFYSAIKASDEYVKFTMLTGVSKFSKVNLFSNLNNLTDITMNKTYGTITGYTQNDLETTFSKHLECANIKKVKRWYNGYNYFSEPIYNPFDILQFIFNDFIFKNYWWETGNPTFLIETLKKSNFYIPDIDRLIVKEETLNAFDVDKIDFIALLWQTGYLTFEKMEQFDSGIEYTMKIPNLEVKNSLNYLFLTYLTSGDTSLPNGSEVSKILKEENIESLIINLKSLFSAIPYNNYVNNEIANYEGYYSSVIYTFLSSLGYFTVAEDVTNRGRIDLTLKTRSAIFIFEFKVDSKEEAIKQIKERKYYEKYQVENKNIYIIGINFDSESKNILEYKWEKI